MKKLLLLIVVITFSACDFMNRSEKIELIPFVQKDQYGYFDLEGKISINPQFQFATAFREDIALVRATGDDGKWGYIDKQGKYIINAIYTNATIFQEGLAWVVTENSAPIAIDKKGDTKFTLKNAETVELFSEGLAAFSIPDSSSVIWGFVDKSGKQVINPQFAEVRQFTGGKCAVKNKDGKWGYIDDEGKIVINYQFDNANDFIENKAVVYLGEKAGIIDNDGKYILNPQFQHVDIDGDMYAIWQDDKGGWCDKDAKFLINPQFKSINKFGDSDLAAVESVDKYGYTDKDGKLKINSQFEEAWPFMGNVALVKSGDKYGMIDLEGKYVVNPQFEGISIDLFLRLVNKTLKNSLTSRYVDIDGILNIVQLENPENLSFETNFKSIASKFDKTASDFDSSGTTVLIEDKKINNYAKFGFGVLGNATEYDYYTGYTLTNNKPTGFLYGISLTGKASGKAEELEKAFEKKLKNYTLVKKGFANETYTSVYKFDKGYVVCSNNGPDMALFYILKPDFDLNDYLSKITTEKKSPEKETSSPENNYDAAYEDSEVTVGTVADYDY